MLAACTGESNTFPDMKTPPATPPEVYLASSEVMQEGHHAASDWTVDGEKIAVRNKQYPLLWPVPLNVSSSDTVVVRFVTESVPGRIEVRQFGGVDPDGKLAGTTLSVTHWNHPKFSSSQFSDDKRLRYNSEVSPPGWELELKVAGTGGVSYMNVWAEWYNRGESYSANWRVSAENTK